MVRDREDLMSPPKPLVPRKAQLRLHALMLEMADANLPIRIVVAKARKEGLSTWAQAVQAYLCENVTGFKAVTLAHTGIDTEAIFGLAKTVYECYPDERTGAITTNKITWPTGSIYQARTAGSDGVGRGSTFNAAHLSEVAFWERKLGMSSDAIRGVFNAVPLVPNTMIIAESTGDGPVGMFYELCTSAERNDRSTPFKLLFIPWYEDEDYRVTPHEGWVPSKDAAELHERYPVLTTDQLYFWEQKRTEHVGAGGTHFEFLREYPSCLSECFTSAEGRVYPEYGTHHLRTLPDFDPLQAPQRGWKLYRSIDWGFGPDAMSVTWIAHSPTSPPGLIVDPICVNLHRELMAYKWDSKSDNPAKGQDDHQADCVRMAVATYRLTGLVYCYREFYMKNAAAIRPDGVARRILELSNWEIPEGDITRAHSGTFGERYDGSCADRSQPGYIAQFTAWNIPCIPHARPAEGAKTRSEVRDGIGLVNTLIGGTSKFYRDRIDTEKSELEKALIIRGGLREGRLSARQTKLVEDAARKNGPQFEEPYYP